MRYSLVLVVIGMIGCGGGGAAPRHTDDEVSATWTSGDDAPLDDTIEEK